MDVRDNSLLVICIYVSYIKRTSIRGTTCNPLMMFLKRLSKNHTHGLRDIFNKQTENKTHCFSGRISSAASEFLK